MKTVVIRVRLDIFNTRMPASGAVSEPLLPPRAPDSERVLIAERVLSHAGITWKGPVVYSGGTSWTASADEDVLIPLSAAKKAIAEYMKQKIETLFVHVVLRRRPADLLRSVVLSCPERFVVAPSLLSSVVANNGFPDECRVEFAKKVQKPRFSMEKVLESCEKTFLDARKQGKFSENEHRDIVRFVVVGRLAYYLQECGSMKCPSWYGSEPRIPIPCTSPCVISSGRGGFGAGFFEKPLVLPTT